MGVTAIWISPPVDNLNLSVPFAGQPTASYHGYQGRDFKRIEEHSGDSANTWDGIRQYGCERARQRHQGHR